VSIDIKPGSNENPVNLNSKGVVPVAILTTDRFNAAASVDLSSATFGHRGDEAKDTSCKTEDVDNDGDQDVICHFRMQETGLDTDDESAVLRAKTVDGLLIGGLDYLRIVPPKH